ncbi:hypothetical protein PLEOSDRAFT_154091 [Pleurotus ostreatus PC15]|uniref:Uncharacterized protein n=1 Tax=Pleurotus ostreatus (strain PC15) TaxID=1137138 RepID=A0A067P7N0_PLEO1|nr:hypothetical protein PLEOSDRAFT_154091 [Pleurotus ostreatus PC15]
MLKERDDLNMARTASSRYMELIHSTIQERPRTHATPRNGQFATLPSWVGSLFGVDIAIDNVYLYSLSDSNLKQPSGLASSPRSALQKATSRLKAGRTSEVAIRSQLKEQSNLLNQANREVKALRAELDQKRRVALLLETLARKEDIRFQRFSEIRVLIDELRKSAANVYAQELPSVPNEPEGVTATGVDGSSYLQDTLTTLHAHRIHTLRLSRQPPAPDPVPSLRIAVAKQPEDGPSVQRMVDQLVDRARRKAQAQSSHHSILSPRTPEHDVDIDELSSAVRNQHKELHELSDLSILLIHLSQNYIRSIRAFTTETLPVISNTLDESRRLAEGETYIGVLKNTVTFSEPPPNGQHNTAALAEVCHPNSTTLYNTIDRVKRSVTQCQQRADFIANTLKAPEDDIELPALVAKHEESTSKADEYASTLLERKAKKVEQAERLVRDVQRYIKDGRLLAGIE